MKLVGPLLVVCMSLPLVAGCDLYQEDDCVYGSTGSGGAGLEAPVADDWRRDPFSGQCQAFGGGWDNYPPCDGECGPCPGYPTDQAAVPTPSWGICYGYCDSLGETDCLDTSGCRAAYTDTCPPNATCDALEKGDFIGCWAVDSYGPLQDGSCRGLDGYECSLYDDCIAIHATSCAPEPNGEVPVGCYGPFAGCLPESATCTDDSDCDVNETCLNDDGFQPTPGGTGTCVPSDNPVGVCYGEVLCDSLAPDCPAGTLPGIIDDCYSGYCIPEDKCEIPSIACTEIEAEATCIARADCSPLSVGTDCTCVGDQCDCTWTYQSCIDAE